MNRTVPRLICLTDAPTNTDSPFQAKTIRRTLAWTCLSGIVLVAALGFGCQPTEPQTSLPDPLVTNQSHNDAKLRQALDFLNRLNEFDQETAHAEILKNLREWMLKQSVDPNWAPDPLAKQLPASYSGMVTPNMLAQAKFDNYDTLVLQEATWLRDIAQSVVQRNQPCPGTAQLLRQLVETVPQEQANDLAHATLLFDWTVRNLQLDYPVRRGESHRLNSDVIFYAWESLLLGRGTVEEKSRVFLLLCRQLGLPVVMLAVDRSETGRGLVPWLPALLLEDQLYLFDMRMGTPIPGPDGVGIATIAQVVDSPQLLENLELFPDHLYPIKTNDFKNIVALIDATPHALSQRMEILESRLVEDDKMVLTTSPSTITEALAECEAVQGVGIWTLPYDGFIVRSRLQQDDLAMMSLALEHSLFDRKTPLGPARILHFRGQYDNQHERPGAQSLYLECRTSEQQIESVGKTPVQTAEGKATTSPSAQEVEGQRRRLANIRFVLRRTKENATYWLGLLAFDRGRYGVSIDHLEKRLLRVSPDTRWKSGASYNLGRAYEARGHATGASDDLERALELYKSVTNTPNAAACQWRAQRLQAFTSKRTSSP